MFLLAALHDVAGHITGNGLQSRDLVHVFDVCTALAMAARKKYVGTPLHICTGRQTTMRALHELAACCIDPDASKIRQPGFVPGAFTGPDLVPVSPSAAESEIDWSPRVDLLTGLQATAAYLRGLVHDKESPEISKIWKGVAKGWPPRP
jgi:nucleoside-diphosphate-sugar epimerase